MNCPKTTKTNYLVILFLSLSLAACGGGGGGGGDRDPIQPPQPPPPPPPVDHSGLTPITVDVPEEGEHLSGGETTVFVSDEDAFSSRPTAVTSDFELDGLFTSGDHIFRTPHSDAGPLLNASNCQGCHINDARGNLPDDANEPFVSAVVKIGNSLGESDLLYGEQIQTFAIQSFDTSDFQSGWPEYLGSINGDRLFGEAYPYVEFEEATGSYPDGTSYSLRRPINKVRDMSFGDFGADIQFSVRVAPMASGVGLLGAIPQENILALADENDDDGDGISGRASMVTDLLSGEQTLGRFSYKAQTATVLQQVVSAYNGDIGITNSILREETCTTQQVSCTAVAQAEKQVGDEVDITDLELAQVEIYNRILGIPARRGYDENTDSWQQNVVAGRKHFMEIGCASCHTPRHVTGIAQGSALGQISLTGLSEDAEPLELLSDQTIYPYTDLLLHDMGGSCAITRETQQGEPCTEGAECLYVQRCDGLADGLPQGMASGSEWRTPPLWGLGLVQVVNAKATFLHDGRARTIEEAILWHGGEAQSANNSFKALNQTERAELMAFLGSL